jgi:anti-anti-sigma factor
MQANGDGGHAVGKLHGKPVLETVSGSLQEMRPQSVPSLVLDMSGLAFLDSAGVGALVQLFAHRRNQGRRFAPAALTQQGMAVMQVSALLKFMPGFASVTEAEAATQA